MFSYESLEIWQLAIEYAKDIYLNTAKFPTSEQFGLVSQLRRAVVSISANIAEGSGSSTTKDKLNYLDISIKSALEVTSELQLAYELGFISQEIRNNLYQKAELLIKRMRSFKNFLKKNTLKP